MFYLAPLFLIALLAWVERGAPRPLVVSVSAAAACALVLLAIPFDRFLTTSAISDTLMLLPLWSLQDRIGEEWIATAALTLGMLLAAAFLFVPRRFALVLPFLVLGLWAVSLRPIWWGAHGFEQVLAGRSLPGDPRATPGLGRPCAPRRRHRCLPLDGADGPVDREPERVLQPRRGSGVLRGRSHAGNAPGDPGHDRPAHRSRDASRRGARHRRVPAGRRDLRARGAGDRLRPRVGHPALAGERPARVGDARGRSLPERDVVGEGGHVRPSAVRPRTSRRRPLERRRALRRAPDRRRACGWEGDRPGPTAGWRACCALGAARAAPGRGRVQGRVHGFADRDPVGGQRRCERRRPRPRRPLQPLPLFSPASR